MTNTPDRPAPSSRFPETDDFAKGPGVGELLPDFTLPDQHGKTVTLSEGREGGRALVVFIRSASW